MTAMIFVGCSDSNIGEDINYTVPTTPSVEKSPPTPPSLD